MAGTFDLMRANDLIWNYVVSNWLMGEDPPAFDILTWNADSTRMPAAMHSFYLRGCYLENQLARGDVELAGAAARLSKQSIRTCTSWPPSRTTSRRGEARYQDARCRPGDVRFVLSIVRPHRRHRQPADPKSQALASDDDRCRTIPDEWLAGATQIPGTWWEDWATWAEPRAGERSEPPTMGSDAHPPLEDAPGPTSAKR